VAGYISHELLHRHAREQVLGEARLVMEAALAIRGYTVAQVRPHLNPLMDKQFLPQTVPAYAATETLAELRKKYPNYDYKEATLNPTNPATGRRTGRPTWSTASATAPTARRSPASATRPPAALYIAHPIRIETAACLPCHSTPDVAPASMIKVYGTANGFGWKLNEVVGAQVVSVPMSVPLENAGQAFRTFMVSLAAVFAAVFVVLNLMLSWLIIGPVSRMSAAADKISTGDFDQPEFPRTARRSGGARQLLQPHAPQSRKAMQMIDSEPRGP
jgi:protein-histidine pros-kinase